VFDEKVDDVNALFNEAIALVEGKSGKSGKTAELSDRDSKAVETSSFKTKDLETVSITGDASTAVKKAEEIVSRPPVKKKPSKAAESSVKAPEKPVKESPPVLLKADESTVIDETQLSKIGTFGDIYKTFLHILINPGSYFETTYLSALEALNYIMVFYFLQMLFQVGYYFMGVRFSVKKLIYIGVFLLIVYVGLIVATAVLSLLVHILASSFNGKGRYGVCFSIVAYAGGTIAGAAVALLFIYRLFLFAGGKTLLFVLAAVMILYGIYIIVKGLKEQYELNENMAYLITFIAFAPVSLYLFFYLPVYFTKFLQIKIPGVQ
jgi:hypothetical protein